MTGSERPGRDIVQSDNMAGGHLAGGNITANGDTSTIHVSGDYIQQAHVPRDTALSRLYKRLRDEVAGDHELTEYIDQLQIFTRSVEDEEVIGLDGKFIAANRSDQLDMAKAMKETIYGQLRKNMFSKTFQTIYATLMAKIYEEFQTWVRPAIARGADRAEIDQLVHIHVVKPIVAELEMCPDYEGAPITIVRGMMYFLTGNCHLMWH
jgi:hypothetical protein